VLSLLQPEIKGGREENLELVEALVNLLEAQDYKCAYTSKELHPGGNATLDHKLPQVRGGATTLKNLHWVDAKVNSTKNNLSHDEFLVALGSKNMKPSYEQNVNLDWVRGFADRNSQVRANAIELSSRDDAMISKLSYFLKTISIENKVRRKDGTAVLRVGGFVGMYAWRLHIGFSDPIKARKLDTMMDTWLDRGKSSL
jgi:hypothetical protein